MERLLVQTASVDEFVLMMRDLSWINGTLMAFSVTASCLESYRFDETFLSTTEQGRIFSPEGELKWRRIGNYMRMVYLGEERSLPNFDDCSHQLEKIIFRRERQLYLWGIRSDLEHEWLEQQVPHHFQYPIFTAEHPQGRVVLYIRDFIDASGNPQFSRYLRLEEVEGEQYA